MQARNLLTAAKRTGAHLKGTLIMTNETNTPTIYTVEVYDEHQTLTEIHEYKSLDDATTHMEHIEAAPHLYPGITAELKYN